MLWRPDLLATPVAGAPKLKALFEMLFTEMAPFCRTSPATSSMSGRCRPRTGTRSSPSRRTR